MGKLKVGFRGGKTNGRVKRIHPLHIASRRPVSTVRMDPITRRHAFDVALIPGLAHVATESLVAGGAPRFQGGDPESLSNGYMLSPSITGGHPFIANVFGLMRPFRKHTNRRQIEHERKAAEEGSKAVARYTDGLAWKIPEDDTNNKTRSSRKLIPCSLISPRWLMPEGLGDQAPRSWKRVAQGTHWSIEESAGAIRFILKDPVQLVLANIKALVRGVQQLKNDAVAGMRELSAREVTSDIWSHPSHSASKIDEAVACISKAGLENIALGALILCISDLLGHDFHDTDKPGESPNNTPTKSSQQTKDKSWQAADLLASLPDVQPGVRFLEALYHFLGLRHRYSMRCDHNMPKRILDEYPECRLPDASQFTTACRTLDMADSVAERILSDAAAFLNTPVIETPALKRLSGTEDSRKVLGLDLDGLLALSPAERESAIAAAGEEQAAILKDLNEREIALRCRIILLGLDADAITRFLSAEARSDLQQGVEAWTEAMAIRLAHSLKLDRSLESNTEAKTEAFHLFVANQEKPVRGALEKVQRDLSDGKDIFASFSLTDAQIGKAFRFVQEVVEIRFRYPRDLQLDKTPKRNDTSDDHDGDGHGPMFDKAAFQAWYDLRLDDDPDAESADTTISEEKSPYLVLLSRREKLFKKRFGRRKLTAALCIEAAHHLRVPKAQIERFISVCPSKYREAIHAYLDAYRKDDKVRIRHLSQSESNRRHKKLHCLRKGLPPLDVLKQPIRN